MYVESEVKYLKSREYRLAKALKELLSELSIDRESFEILKYLERKEATVKEIIKHCIKHDICYTIYEALRKIYSLEDHSLVRIYEQSGDDVVEITDRAKRILRIIEEHEIGFVFDVV